VARVVDPAIAGEHRHVDAAARPEAHAELRLARLLDDAFEVERIGLR